MNSRIVLDTNVFLSGIFWEGNYCSQIITAWRAGRLTLICSIEIVQELVEVLRDFKIEMPEEVINEWKNVIIENAVMVIPTEKVGIVVNDFSDNKFFEAAIAGKADYIISQDKHILKIREYKRIKTISPEEFMKLA
ncbi:MAG TPA: putative toxin-antitoxin system toxin component, PIN family [Candidatus Nanoarchaeia archaeon]|nr:putative toxin-antitoxin system toxin component, PIN family [Candidatus Nanoarchaeia archaeon]